MGSTEWGAEGSVPPRQTLQPDTGRKPGAGTPATLLARAPCALGWGSARLEGGAVRGVRALKPALQLVLPRSRDGNRLFPPQAPTASGCWDGFVWTVGAPYSVPAVAWASRCSTRPTPGHTWCPRTWDQVGDTLVGWAGSLAPWIAGLKPLAEDSRTTSAVGASLRRGRPPTPTQP